MTIYHEAPASARLDGETMHAPTPEHDCCLAHALERIAELKYEIVYLTNRLLELKEQAQ